MTARDRLIVALDLPDSAGALSLVTRLGESVSFYKVGLQLFTAEGPEFVRRLSGLGKQVFLDLKLHDIPNTVASAVRSVAGLGIDLLTVHAAGGTEMLRDAQQEAKSAAHPPMLLAVTVLTSLAEADLRSTGITSSPGEQVTRLADLALQAGCGGVVASPLEVAHLRATLTPKLVIVVPGIRPRGSAAGDQQRIAAPGDALQAGADYLVVGRPITAAPDPQAAVEAILSEMEPALAAR